MAFEDLNDAVADVLSVAEAALVAADAGAALPAGCDVTGIIARSCVVGRTPPIEGCDQLMAWFQRLEHRPIGTFGISDGTCHTVVEVDVHVRVQRCGYPVESERGNPPTCAQYSGVAECDYAIWWTIEEALHSAWVAGTLISVGSCKQVRTISGQSLGPQAEINGFEWTVTLQMEPTP